ncbi:M17 family metallopeptidase [Desertibaculum subflavum]|uniref:M17 family metallopeptidase n=1 Tax=Desertibaculum subflavum TaxID=2268458 RepID=UPI0034D1F0EC
MKLRLVDPSSSAVPIHLVPKEGLDAFKAGQPAETARWLDATAFRAEAGSVSLVPGSGGTVAAVVLGTAKAPDTWTLAGAAADLPPATYRLAAEPEGELASRLALGWALGSYRFDRFRKPDEKPKPDLVWPKSADRAGVTRLARWIAFARDLISTPTEAMGPAELAAAAQGVAEEFGAKFSTVVGQALLDQNYPMIHAVGRAAAREPRLIDFTWGDPSHPKVTLVGKGVCFDSGGLDIKPADGMLMMKKDMGGAAILLALAGAIMQAGLKVRLRLLIPAVENAISGSAFRPGDIFKSRKGITVEIGNTDAEGRLILSDALAEADSEAPELLIDAATLTGAARVALGADLPALFTDDDTLAADLARLGNEVDDPLWRMPLHKPYRKMLESPIADINNVSRGGFAGAVTAAVFLNEFVGKAKAWAHLDLYAWNADKRPGRPVGGEATALRCLHALLVKRYGG